ncbi:MAG: alpha-glycosidase [Oscillospiraceae bacterium]|nr:alpha-glycosidase [Oscillospiraceae bacterium]
MEQWLESVHSDGTEEFVSNPSPKLFEMVQVRIRMYEDAPVKHVLLRSNPNGEEHYEEMQVVKIEHGLKYYEAPLRISENRMPYQFYLVCEDVVYFYTQNGITTYVPDLTYDFVLLADYVQPEWVKDAVFYQIFPERFCNGDPSNDVRDGEYARDGHPTIRMKSWDDPCLTYQEGFCLDFYGGDLQGVKEKIPYLKELGVTAVYLNPIFTAPSVHKYDCLDYFHVDPHFGGDEALAELSAALHENGMKLILDISINHTGIDHKWFNKDGIWFNKSEGAYNNHDAPERGYYFFGEDNSYLGWLGVETLPTLNYTSGALREIIYRSEDSVLKKWLKPPYSIDGWRFDVANIMGRKDELQLSHELWPEIRRSIREVNPQAYILAEEWGDCAAYLQGSEWDAPMNYYGCGRVIRQFLGEPDLFMARNPILRNIPYKMTAQDVKHRVMEHLAKMPYALQQNQFNLFDSHDVSRLHNNPKVHPDEYRGAVIFQFMLPGAASIYYGDEAAADGVLGSNEGCRYPMPWSKDIKNGEAYRLNQTMAKLKAEHKALSHGGMKFLYAQGQVIAIARFWGDEVYVGILSTDDKDVKIRLPLGAVGAKAPRREIFGKELEYGQLDDAAVELTVKAHQAYFMECQMR